MDGWMLGSADLIHTGSLAHIHAYTAYTALQRQNNQRHRSGVVHGIYWTRAVVWGRYLTLPTLPYYLHSYVDRKEGRKEGRQVVVRVVEIIASYLSFVDGSFCQDG